MTDIKLQESFSLQSVTMDWLLKDNGRLDESEELATAVRVALGTDALAEEDEILPDPDSQDRRGWWGDLEAEQVWGGWPIGTKNWLLQRAKISGSASMEGDTVQRAKIYALTALQPLIEQRVCSHIEVDAERVGLTEIDVSVFLFRGPREEIALRFQLLWNGIKEA